jgi:DNA-binding transcriptional MerR regulator
MDELTLQGLTQAAAELNISISHLRNLADQKVIPSMRDSVGRRLFFPADLAALKAARARAKAAKEGKPKLILKSRRAE